MSQQLRRIFNLWLVLALIAIGLPAIAHAQAVPFDQHPHGHDCVSAGEISLNSDVKALLFDPADYAFYRIVLPQRGLLDVSIDPGAFDAWNMELLDSSCQPVSGATSDNSLVTGKWARITVPHKGLFTSDVSLWTLASGLYFVRIKPNPVDVFQEAFAFRTRFTPHYGHDCETAENAKAPGAIDGELLYSADREVFRVETTETGLIRAWTTGELASSKQPSIRIYTSDCSTDAAQQTSEEQQGTLSGVLAPHVYYVSVEPGKPDYLGKFTLHLEFIRTSTGDDILEY